MSDQPHIESGRWPMLLSLPEDDPERQTALAHAAGCAACEMDRKAGERLLEDLVAVPKASPPADALERAALPVRQALAAEGAVRRNVRWVEVSAAVGAFGLVLTLATRSNGAWGPALLLLGAAVLVPWLAGSLRAWGPMVLTAVTASFAISRVVDSQLSSHLANFGCAGMEALAAVLPLAALAWMSRSRGLIFGSLAYAGAAASGALAGQAALLLTCPSHDLSHLLVLHSGTVLMAAMIGAGVPRLIPSLAQ